MSSILIPQNKQELTLSEDWSVELQWIKRNLRMLAKYNLTGMKEVDRYSGARWDAEEKKYVHQTVVRNETVPNKLFMDYEGNYTPVEITFPKDTIFIVSRYHYNNQTGIDSVEFKCSGSPKKGIKGLCIQVKLDKLNGMPVNSWLT